ncbi:MAG: hypothetical protein F6K28_13155 [Microcoleus sp. SIO2G3]|nr:hypothetical protein [Microcoleus sp. SIO2G3]
MNLLLSEHRLMICEIKCLPEYSVQEVWTKKQAEFIFSEHNYWQWIGIRIDYLQARQLGFLPIDPLFSINHLEIRETVEVFSNYFFNKLQVIIHNFEVIYWAAQKRNRQFSFANPRNLFVQICKEHSRRSVVECSSHRVNVGTPIKELRNTLCTIGKFYRGTLPPDLIAEKTESMLGSPSWSDFTMGAVCEKVKRKYLDKQDYWKEFRSAQKAMYRLSKKPNQSNMLWNAGYPVYASSRQPVSFLPVP